MVLLDRIANRAAAAKEKLAAAKDAVADTFGKREDGELPHAVVRLMEKLESEEGGEVKTMVVVRTPVEAYVGKLMDAISRGKYSETIANSDYDQMFHLYILINGKYILEKNEVICFYEPEDPRIDDKKDEFMRVPRPKGSLTLRSLLMRTRAHMGDADFSNYSARSNNCQSFVLGVLNGNDLCNEMLTKFIFQDAEKIFQELPERTTGIAVGLTDVAAVGDNMKESIKHLKTRVLSSGNLSTSS